MPPLSYDKITLETFKKTVARYPAVAPKTSKWRDNDEFRYQTIPQTVEEREKEAEKKKGKKPSGGGENEEVEKGGVYLKKDEVVRLMEWKLMHGTFRPSLMNLINRNTDALVEEKTRDAYQLLTKTSEPNILPALTHLSTATAPLTSSKGPATKQPPQKLSGVGPATASLFLSVMDMRRVPFFSDELFRWVMWEGSSSSPSSSAGANSKKSVGTGKSDGTEEGWRRKIKYDMKEYAQLLERVAELRKRLDVSAVEVEKCAWVLGAEGVDVGKDKNQEGGEAEKVVGEEASDKTKTEEKLVEKGKQKEETAKSVKAKTKQTSAKRKREEPISPPRGVRRSTRRKTSNS